EVRDTLGIVRGPASLAGLENLQEVQVLLLESPRAESLRPLSGLRRARTLSIRGDMPQGTLLGLGGILNLRELLIQESSLTTLVGLALPARMDSIVITGSATSDLGVLAGVSRVDRDLGLNAVRGLQSLEPLAGMTSVGSLGFSDNPDLVHIDALQQLTGLDNLFVFGNPKLEHLPDFDGVRSLQTVSIQGNPLLRNVPRFSQATRFSEVAVRGNPLLESVVFPSLSAGNSSSFPSTVFAIYENEALTQISAAALTQLDFMLIAANPALASTEFPQLQAVSARMTVIMNPLLPSATLGSLLTAGVPLRKVGANQGDVPLASCPWTDDSYCDESSNACAPGSDLVDCNNGYPPY
ncbi:MAG: hypothetical protein ABW217_06020, partial [Polyangiaceae bacterium]